MKISKLNIEFILASEEEEFFYKDSNEPVPEGEPVGVERDSGDSIDLILFDNIYHEFK